MSREMTETDLQKFADLVGGDVIDLIAEVAPTKVISRIAKSADHYNKAHALIGIDEEMGVIRLIAAEEELVVAIFEHLKLNSDVMPEHRDFIGKFKNHWVKLAFHPVLSQFRFVLTDMAQHGFTMDGLEKILTLQAKTIVVERRVAIRISDADGKITINANPLAALVSRGEWTEREVVDELFKDFAKLIKEQHGGTIREFVRQRAEFRNKVLYAEDGGFATMDHSLKQLLEVNFRPSLRDLLWCLGVLLTNEPIARTSGIVSQFVGLYRRVLVEAGILQPEEG